MLCEGTNIPSDVMREFTVPKNREHTHIYIRVMLEEEAEESSSN
jgi:hypothetical protein